MWLLLKWDVDELDVSVHIMVTGLTCNTYVTLSWYNRDIVFSTWQHVSRTRKIAREDLVCTHWICHHSVLCHWSFCCIVVVKAANFHSESIFSRMLSLATLLTFRAFNPLSLCAVIQHGCWLCRRTTLTTVSVFLFLCAECYTFTVFYLCRCFVIVSVCDKGGRSPITVSWTSTVTITLLQCSCTEYLNLYFRENIKTFLIF